MLTEYIKYYYLALPDFKKKIYMQIYNGVKNKQDRIDIFVNVFNLSAQDLHEIITAVYNDTPAFYYLKITCVSYATTMMGYTVFPEYIYTTQEIDYFDRQLENGLRMFCNKYISPDMSEYQKEIAIHDYLVRTVTYDHEATVASAGAMIDEAYNVLGALLKRRAVCWGIACAFKLMCDYCKVRCFVVIGDTKPKESEAGHAWNMVNLDGDSYHIDVTWDIKEKGDISFCYDYLNLDDNLIQFDHSWESKLYPKCSSNRYNYYFKNGLYVKTIDQLERYITQKLNSGTRYIAVKFANSMPPRYIIEAAIQNGLNRSYVYRSCIYYISEKTHNIYIEI